MKKIILLLSLISYFSTLDAQTIADFENFNLDDESFLNGSDGNNLFGSGNISLINDYNMEWDSWTGFAISNSTDTSTPGFMNQYACIAGEGVDGSQNYGVAYVVQPSLLYTTGNAVGGVINGFYINNSTYTYLSMREGDAFAKKFGGEDGTDPDYLYVSIKEYGDRNVSNDSLNFYLADFRSDTPSEDYLVSEWTYVDLSQFENIDTLQFTMYSSDVGAFGINTPTYFCIDNIETADIQLTSSTEPRTDKTKVFPNPANDYINIEALSPVNISLHDFLGHRIKEYGLHMNKRLDLQELPRGAYYLKVASEKGDYSSKPFIKS